MTPVPFCRLAPLNAQADLAGAMQRVMDRDKWILGSEVEVFERDWATFCGYRFAVGVGNGFDALRLMLEAYGIGPGDDVIVPTNTYIATWLAVTAVGAYVVPVEPDLQSALLDPNGVESAMRSRRIRAVLAVHLYGRQCDMAALRGLADRHGALLLTDAAQGHGLKDLGDAAAFSFYPTKNLGALGDAGAVVTNNERIAERVRWLRNYGSNAKDVHVIRGVNSRLDELQAAFLRAKLPLLCSWNHRRAANAMAYRARLPLEWLRLSPVLDDVTHQFVVRHRERDRMQAALKHAGIGTMVHYPTPPHLQPAYRACGWGPKSFPVAEELARSCLSLPVGPELNSGDVLRVIDAASYACRVAA